MTKKIFWRANVKRTEGTILALTMFVVAILVTVISLSLSAVVGRVQPNVSDARLAANVCIQQLDYNFGKGDNYAGCTAGQYVVLGSNKCVNDLSLAAGTTHTVGDNCSCAVSYGGYDGVSKHNMYSLGRCNVGNAVNRTSDNFIEADVYATISSSTQACTADCSVKGDGSCCDGCGGGCNSLCSGGTPTCNASTCLCQ